MGNTIFLNPLSQKFKDNNLQAKLNEVGKNTGNLVFVEALKKQLNINKELNLYALDAINDVCVQPLDSIVIPSSNFIRYGGNIAFYEKLLELLDITNCSVTMIGLGAQSNRYMDTPWKLVKYGLNPVKINLLKRMAERTISIGIRGEFTAECLELLGIKNYKIIGCPSFYNSFDCQFPQISKPNPERVLINVTPNSSKDGRLLDFGIRENATWVTQTVNDVPQTFTIGSTMFIAPEWRYRKFSGLQASSKKVWSYYQNNAKCFFDMNDWEAFYRANNFTFSVGSRFHGNMSALRNGVPALWIAHDSRTKELTRTLHLPHVSCKQIASMDSIENLIEYCEYSNTVKHYPKLLEYYVEFLNENNINHKFSL